MSHLRDLISTSKVIDALGGTTVVAREIGDTPQVVCNWRARGFPPTTYLWFYDRLSRIGMSAPADLWSMRPMTNAGNASRAPAQCIE